MTARRDDALARVGDSGTDYARAVRAHLTAASELALPDSAAAFAALEAWLETVSGANPLELAVSAAGRDAARRIERAQVQASAGADEIRAVIDGLEREMRGAGVRRPPRASRPLHAGIGHPKPPRRRAAVAARRLPARRLAR